jgi:DNA-binding response OmpR family regulator
MARSTRIDVPLHLLVANARLSAAALAHAVAAHWQGCEVHVARDAESTWREFTEFDPELVVLARELPGAPSLELLRRMREISDVPILVTAEGADDLAEIRALTEGADDFLREPYADRVLLARIQALLRRTQLGLPSQSEPDFELDGLQLWYDPPRSCVDGRAVHLTATEFRLLQVLALRPGRVLPAEFLLAQVWGADGQATTRDLKVMLSRVRQKVDPQQRRIRTHRHLGYQLLVPTGLPVPSADPVPERAN